MLKLRIGDVAAAEKVYQTAGEAYKDIGDGLAASTNIANAATSAMAVKWHAKWVKHSEIIRQVLQDWVASSDYFLIRLLSGQARESKTYTSYLGIAKAVVGEAKSRPNLLKERDLALDAKSNGSIDRDLCGLIKKIHRKVANPVGWRSPCPNLAWHRGAYWPIGYKTYNFETLLANPAADGNVTLKVAVLHDIMDVLKDHGPLAATVVPGGVGTCAASWCPIMSGDTLITTFSKTISDPHSASGVATTARCSKTVVSFRPPGRKKCRCPAVRPIRREG